MFIKKLFKNHQRKSQAGFIAAPLLFGIAASIAALALAGNYVNIFDKLIDNQNRVQSKAKLEQMAAILADASGDYGGVVSSPPPMSASNGGATMSSAPSIDQSGISSGGRLPTGFSTSTRMGDILYYAFIHEQSGTEGQTTASTPGYYLGGAGGIPAPDEVAFALIIPSSTGLTTTVEDIRNKITRGNDIGVFRTVKEVNRQSYKRLLESAGNIPRCGIKMGDDGREHHTELAWDFANKKWECVRSEIRDFAAITSTNPAATACAPGQSLTTLLLQDGASSLTCTITTAIRNRSQFGVLANQDGGIDALVDDRMSLVVPCGGDASLLLWNPASALNPIDCGAYGTSSAATRSCPVGQYVGRAFTHYSGCFQYNAANLALNGGVGWRSRCSGGETPYVADGRTFCPEDGRGGRPLCRDGFETVFMSTQGGIGCYITSDPQTPDSIAQFNAVHYLTANPCPEGSYLRITASDRRLASCTGLFSIISHALPAATCPAFKGKAGFLTWDGNRFLCKNF